MKIQGRFQLYDCKWRGVGFTYAEVIIYGEVEKSFLGMKYTKTQELWATGTYKRENMQKALPDNLREKFAAAVDEYERYKEAWDREYSIIDVEEVEEALHRAESNYKRLTTKETQ